MAPNEGNDLHDALGVDSINVHCRLPTWPVFVIDEAKQTGSTQSKNLSMHLTVARSRSLATILALSQCGHNLSKSEFNTGFPRGRLSFMVYPLIDNKNGRKFNLWLSAPSRWFSDAHQSSIFRPRCPVDERREKERPRPTPSPKRRNYWQLQLWHRINANWSS